jgi:phenylalanyl-tRNA synthetase alpha chain
MESQEALQSIYKEFEEELKKVRTIPEVDQLKSRFIGKKGALTSWIKKIPQLPPEERRVVGRLVNELKSKIEEAVREKRAEILKAERKRKLDLTLPGTPYPIGMKHPINLVMDRIAEILTGMGFEEALGPLVEWDWYNFEALNFPKLHPARQMQSSFLLAEEMLLRTHTSPVQIRVMEKKKPPIRIYAPGRVYRKDPFDPTHAPIFHQVEGLYVDKNVTFAELKGTLIEFAKELFGPETRVKFVPSYFPFTEPSAEVHLLWRTERGEEWLEILGCGMVHPAVLKVCGIDPDEWTGYAFGLGVERITMILYGINDIRLFFENDLRFIGEFN